ncbi:MAG: phage baseplate protein, partial [Algicola sp.]|nr:phage baseplate protein [Algicola sp.]
FLDGNKRRPCIVGFLYNGQNLPPEDDPQKRTLKTISGHLMVFDDTEGEESITIEDKNGNTIVMNADGIEITTDKTLTLKGNEVIVEADAQLTLKGNPVHINP